MILRREAMPPTARRMLVAIPVVVVPDRADVAGAALKRNLGTV
jgi:hypothetical protein